MLKRNSDWRDQYNPLPGLTMARIVHMENESRRGALSEIQWFYHHMYEADPIVFAAVAKRLAYLDSLDWEIRMVDGADQILAQEQAAVLRYAYEQVQNFRDASFNIGMAVFSGFAVLEKNRTGYGPFCQSFDHIEPWYWNRNGMRGPFLFNPTAEPGNLHGEYIDPRGLIIHESSSALFKPISRNFFAKQLAMADWDQDLENGSVPSIFVIGPEGLNDKEKLEFQNLAEAVTRNLRGFMPNGASIETFDPGNRSRLPYLDRIEFCDKQILISATGGTLTALAEPGSGTLAGSAQQEALLSLARGDAARLSEVYQTQYDKEVLNAFFPKQPRVAYFSFDVPQPTESRSEILGAVSGLSWSGYRVEKEQLSEKLGLTLEEIAPPQ